MARFTGSKSRYHFTTGGAKFCKFCKDGIVGDNGVCRNCLMPQDADEKDKTIKREGL